MQFHMNSITDSFSDLNNTAPKAHHRIIVCNCPLCYMSGSSAIAEAFSRNLGINIGGMTEDKMFALNMAVMKGPCVSAPTVMIDGKRIDGFEVAYIKSTLNKFQFGSLHRKTKEKISTRA